MSLLRITITEEHLKLLKYLRWSINQNNFIVGTEDELIDKEFGPFGSNNLYEAIDLILNGNTQPEFDPLSEEIKEYSDEEKERMDKLYKELPLALDAILYNQSFELGDFVTTYHDRAWKQKFK